jgi:hypothetical protein
MAVRVTPLDDLIEESVRDLDASATWVALRTSCAWMDALDTIIWRYRELTPPFLTDYHRTKPSSSSPLRRDLYEAQGARCAYCLSALAPLGTLPGIITAEDATRIVYVAQPRFIPGGIVKRDIAEDAPDQWGVRHLWDAPQLDHRIPVSRGGPGVRENLCYACTWCNQCKKQRTAEEFALYPDDPVSRFERDCGTPSRVAYALLRIEQVMALAPKRGADYLAARRTANIMSDLSGNTTRALIYMSSTWRWRESYVTIKAHLKRADAAIHELATAIDGHVSEDDVELPDMLAPSEGSERVSGILADPRTAGREQLELVGSLQQWIAGALAALEQLEGRRGYRATISMHLECALKGVVDLEQRMRQVRVRA